MTRAHGIARRRPSLALAIAVLLLGVLVNASRAGAVYGPLGQIGSGELKWGEGGSPGEVEGLEAHGFAIDRTTGDFFIADVYEEGKHVFGRVQKFDATGKPLAENRVELAEVKSKPPEVESLQMAIDEAKGRVYLLVADERNVSKALDEETSVATELYAFSTTVASGKLENQERLVSQAGFEPLATTAPKAPLLIPSGLAVDPVTHDLLITAQQEDGSVKEEEELHAVVQRVHTEGAHKGEFGPRYVDEKNCLDEGEAFAEGEECRKGKGAEEFPSSPIVTPEGKLYVEEQGASGEIWEVPASENSSNSKATAESVERLSTVPKRLFSLGSEERRNKEIFKTRAELVFASNEEQGGSMSFVPGGAGEGTFDVVANIAQGEGEEEEARTGVALIDYTKASQADEQGWTGAGPLAPLTACSVRADARGGRLRVAGTGSGDGILLFESGKIQTEARVETYSEVLGFGSAGKEACGQPSATAPKVEIGEASNLSEVEMGKTVTVSSTMHGANALSTEWKLKYKTGSGEEGEEKAETGYQHRQPGLSHAFQHAGEYEITEIVTTDCLGVPTVSTVRKGLKVTSALSALKTRLLQLTMVRANETATLEAEAVDGDEQPQHLKYKWSYGDGTSKEESTPAEGVSGNAKLRTQHVYSSPGVYEVGLEVENASGAKAARVTGKITVGKSVEEEKIEEEKIQNEAREKAAREQHEREAREKAEREQHEREAREKAEREQREHEQKPGSPGGQGTGDPEAKLAGRSVSVSSAGLVKLEVTCPSAESSCVGTVTLRTMTTSGASTHGKKKALTLASGSFTVTGGKVQTITLHLSAKARALLGHSRVLVAKATLLAHDSAGATRTVNSIVTLRLIRAHGSKR